MIPNCVNVQEYAAFDKEIEPDTLIFTGSFGFEPNYEAMLWFLSDVYPIVQAEVPTIHLTITGDHLNKPLPQRSGTKLTSFVPDVRPYIARSMLSIAPIQTGGGTRLKILEAMALRTPVISTSKGAEGIDVENGKDILIADTPMEFAKAIVELAKTPELRVSIADNAYNLVKDKYDWGKVLPKFMELVDRTVLGDPSVPIDHQ